ncbi:MAG: OsmC family protein [Pseudomonadota bacterium]
MAQEKVKEAITAAAERLEKSPFMAMSLVRAKTEWIEGLCCSAEVRDFPPMIVDEPPELGGTNAAPNPVELVLVALGTCQEIMYAAHAAVMGIQLDSVSCTLKGTLDMRGLLGVDPDIEAGFDEVMFETVLESPAPEEELIELARAVEARCPVLDSLQRAVEVSGTVTANGTALDLDAVE